MLLVHDRQPERGKSHALLDDGMRTDNNVCLTRCNLRENDLALLG